MLRGSYANGFAPRDGQPRYPSLWRGCVGAWHPGLGASGSVLRDWSGHQSHGSLLGLTLANAWSINRGVGELTFAGASGRVDCGRIVELESAPQATASFWCRRNTTSDIVTWAKRTTGPNMYSWICVADGTATFYPASNANFGNITISDELLHHYCYIFDGTRSTNATRLRLFVDGVESALTYTGTIPTTTAAATVNLIFGVFNVSYSTGGFTGMAFYNRALQDSEAILLSRRPGIAYEMRTERYAGESAAGFNPAWVRRRSLIIGGGV